MQVAKLNQTEADKQLKALNQETELIENSLRKAGLNRWLARTHWSCSGELAHNL